MLKKFYKILILAILSLFLNSCGIGKLVTEKNYTYIPKSEIDIENLGNGKVLFFNGDYYCPVVECGWTTKMNVHFNDVSFGQINYGEYFIMEIEEGEYNVELKHWDAINMKSKHKIIIDADTKVIKLKPTAFSNDIQIVNKLPNGFELFNQLIP
ncbi:MAG TPA: hypothetical protein VNJ50_14950 [Gelidibacter sp.]|uniref:hypothetical protein n=1 Tax=Gelidibacter sp. TaxID=2018083 RepID=UPI002CF86253|nr:hypothetical protein [Gelidibacter sp.]HXK00149.1 hypothetical protein [Gelidibacter sp.]